LTDRESTNHVGPRKTRFCFKPDKNENFRQLSFALIGNYWPESKLAGQRFSFERILDVKNEGNRSVFPP